MARQNDDWEDYSSDPEPISRELEELADSAIDYGLEALGNKGSFAPMLFVEDEKGHRETLEFDDEVTEECLSEAHGILRHASRKNGVIEGLEGKPCRYALAYDGAIRDDERAPYKNALIIEYGERGLSCGYSAYLLYKKAGRPKDFVWTEPAAAGETELYV